MAALCRAFPGLTPAAYWELTIGEIRALRAAAKGE